jgi:hypothetical protein
MSEASTGEMEAGLPTGLFLIDGGVDPDVTSLFLRADRGSCIILAGTVDVFRQIAEDYEQAHGENPTHQFLEIRGGHEAIKRFPVFSELVEGPYMRFRSGLARHTGEELRQIETEFTKILTGVIKLTDAQKQQLSNLSDGDLRGYLDAFGIETEDLAFPLLDVGTGLNAYFAQDVLAAFPGRRMVSTSMHLLSPHSLMSRRLLHADPAQYGEIVACSGIEMPFDDDTFGMVVSRNADPYYTPKRDLISSIREKHRVMKFGAVAILCPSVCQYGEHDITDEDLTGLPSEIDATLEPIPLSGKRIYDGNIQNLLVIRK